MTGVQSPNASRTGLIDFCHRFSCLMQVADFFTIQEFIMTTFFSATRRFWADEQGVTAIEYRADCRFDRRWLRWVPCRYLAAA